MKQLQAFIYLMVILLGVECPAATHYVVPTNPAAANPFTNWATAGTSIIEVVRTAATNTGTRLVWVTNGTYYPTNQIVVTNIMTVRSVNGRDMTILDGSAAGNIRCIYLSSSSAGSMGNGGILSGFTITNYSFTNTDGTIYSDRYASILNCRITGNRVASTAGGKYGGGIYAANYTTVTNCIVDGNWATGGGGIYFQQYNTFANCLVENNTADLYNGGGMYSTWSTYQGNLISNCFIINNRCNGNDVTGGGGGGIYINGASASIVSCVVTGNFTKRYGGGLCIQGVTVINSIITENSSTNGSGGGIYGTNLNLRNCLITENAAGTNGGGAYIYNGAKLVNCTIACNSAGVKGGGLYQNGSVWGTNTVVYYNTAPDAPNFTNTAGNSGLDYSCVTPAVGGISNIISDPAFVSVDGGNYRLRMSSPCINAGAYQSWMTNAFDLDLNARLRYGSVDMGAYETYVWQGSVFKAR